MMRCIYSTSSKVFVVGHSQVLHLFIFLTSPSLAATFGVYHRHRDPSWPFSLSTPTPQFLGVFGCSLLINTWIRSSVLKQSIGHYTALRRLWWNWRGQTASHGPIF